MNYIIYYISVIATPGRLLHLIVEMDMELKSVDYIVFDEADRLIIQTVLLQSHQFYAIRLIMYISIHKIIRTGIFSPIA